MKPVKYKMVRVAIVAGMLFTMSGSAAPTQAHAMEADVISMASPSISHMQVFEGETAETVLTRMSSHSNISVNVNGTLVSFANGASPFLESARTMIPVRGVFETMGYTVTWHSDAWTGSDVNATLITISSGDNYLAKPITITKNNVIMQGGVVVESDVAPMLVDGNYYLPIRAIAEATGALVDWDNDTSTVLIDFVKQAFPSNNTTTPTTQDGSNYQGQFGVATAEKVKDLMGQYQEGTLDLADLTNEANYNHEILYANADANNAHNLPEGSYYIKTSNFVQDYNYSNGVSKGDAIIGAYESGGFTLANGKSVYIGQSKASIEATFGEPTATGTSGVHTYATDGFLVYYTSSGRVCQIDIICFAETNYTNSGLSFGTGSITLGETADRSDLGAGESWNEGSPMGVSVVIDGVKISMRFGIRAGAWASCCITATGLE